MRRWLAAGGAVVLIAAAVAAWAWRDTPPGLPSAPATASAAPFRATPQAGDAPFAAPAADPKDREEKRFARYDKDDSGAISRVEFLASRQKAFAKLDTDGDGKISFAEYAAKAATKFAEADANHDGNLSADEMATTAPKRSGQRTLERCRPDPSADA